MRGWVSEAEGGKGEGEWRSITLTVIHPHPSMFDYFFRQLYVRFGGSNCQPWFELSVIS
jgi:hypothetical protein